MVRERIQLARHSCDRSVGAFELLQLSGVRGFIAREVADKEIHVLPHTQPPHCVSEECEVRAVSLLERQRVTHEWDQLVRTITVIAGTRSTKPRGRSSCEPTLKPAACGRAASLHASGAAMQIEEYFSLVSAEFWPHPLGNGHTSASGPSRRRLRYRATGHGRSQILRAPPDPYAGD
jgi:hypothetical protein